MLERTLTVSGSSQKLTADIGYLKYRPWRLQILVDDDIVKVEKIGNQDETIARKDVQPNAGSASPEWTSVSVDLSKYAGKTVKLRLYQWLTPDDLPGAAYWRSIKIE
jgi:bacillopeptidase F (M6 metalloprotease family)